MPYPSVMCLPDISPVVIAQATLYSHVIGDYHEQFTGCPLKCKFCHYTWARRRKGSNGAYDEYVQTSLTGGGTPELTWDGLATYGRKAGRIRVAIDGFSERLRYLYGKPISNADILYGIKQIGQYGPNATTLLVYNIANMPGEGACDREELYATLKQCEPRYRVIFVLQSTPFRPSLATPMQWEGVALDPDWSRMRTRVIVDRPRFRAVHSFTLETSWSHLCSVVAERATVDTDTFFHALAFAPGFQRGNDSQKLALARKSFDLTPYLRAYEPGEAFPAWFLRSYTAPETLIMQARKMRATAKDSLIKWERPGTSLVEKRLRRRLSSVFSPSEQGT